MTKPIYICIAFIVAFSLAQTYVLDDEYYQQPLIVWSE
jgi:hypothetical protein